MDTERRARAERAWGDDDAAPGADAYEPTYRDGGVMHECWRGDRCGRCGRGGKGEPCSRGARLNQGVPGEQRAPGAENGGKK